MRNGYLDSIQENKEYDRRRKRIGRRTGENRKKDNKVLCKYIKGLDNEIHGQSLQSV